MKIIHILLFITFFACAIDCQVFRFGTCVQPPIIPNFQAQKVLVYLRLRYILRPKFNANSLSKYAGKWFEYQRYPSLTQLGLDCVTATYGFVNATQVTVKNHGYNM